MNRPAPAFTACRSESSRKRLHVRSTSSSSRSTIARARPSALGSVTPQHHAAAKRLPPALPARAPGEGHRKFLTIPRTQPGRSSIRRPDSIPKPSSVEAGVSVVWCLALAWSVRSWSPGVPAWKRPAFPPKPVPGWRMSPWAPARALAGLSRYSPCGARAFLAWWCEWEAFPLVPDVVRGGASCQGRLAQRPL